MSEKFEYKYEAPTIEERKEIDNIRRQYLPQDKSITKMERLRSLDKRVKSIPQIYGLTLGIVGVLTFGLGLTFFLEWSNLWYIGIPCSIIGIILMSFAYYLHNKVLEKLKAKYGQEIIDLSNELLNEESKSNN